MTLLLDFGNSRLKWGWAREGRVVGGGALSYADLSDARLETAFHSSPPERVLAVSVTATVHRQRVEEWLWLRWRLEPHYLRSAPEAHGVASGYLQPERLGADRWAVLIAARALTTEPVCIVDCGSAVTVDALDAAGQHRGGVILPGLSLMRRALAQGTSALPLIEDAPVTIAARDTASAIASGTLLGLAAAVDGLARAAAARLEVEPRLFITGGDARALSPYLQLDYEERPDMVLEGLAVVAERAP